jgi:cytochrome c-type protein NapB
MTSERPRAAAVVLGFFLVVSALLATIAIIVASRRISLTRAPRAAAPVAVGIVAPPDQPIAAEALVFSTRPSSMAIEPKTQRYREAHPRTLKTYRYLRAFPGAPPRIPHGLTPTEFRTGACKTCHERGGYSRRFSAYVPVTPHPQMGMCLQCHVGEDALTGRVSSDPNDRCHQCHGSGGKPHPPAETTLTWRAPAWPQFASRTRDGSPPPIPHDLETRGNCLACHAGPAAVAEIRTTHPEQGNCRQCHLALDPNVGEFQRPAPEILNATGSVP